MALHTKLCDLLGVKHPIMLAGMGGVSYSKLVAAVSPVNASTSPGTAVERPRITPQAAPKRRIQDVDMGRTFPSYVGEGTVGPGDQAR